MVPHLLVLSPADVLRWLVETEELELFLARKFPSAKRFGLQGCDVIMPALFSAIVRGG